MNNLIIYKNYLEKQIKLCWDAYNQSTDVVSLSNYKQQYMAFKQALNALEEITHV